MNLERFCIKFFAQSQNTLSESALIEIFHEWIRLKTCRSPFQSMRRVTRGRIGLAGAADFEIIPLNFYIQVVLCVSRDFDQHFQLVDDFVHIGPRPVLGRWPP